MNNVKVVSISANFVHKNCVARCELYTEVNGFNVTNSSIEVPINKLYSTINPAVVWEAATILSNSGFEVVVPEKPTEGVLE